MTKPKKPGAKPAATPPEQRSANQPAAAAKAFVAGDLPETDRRHVRVRATRTGFYICRRRPGDVFDIPVDDATGDLPSWVEAVGEDVPAGAAKDIPPAGSGAPAANDGSVI